MKKGGFFFDTIKLINPAIIILCIYNYTMYLSAYIYKEICCIRLSYISFMLCIIFYTHYVYTSSNLWIRNILLIHPENIVE